MNKIVKILLILVVFTALFGVCNLSNANTTSFDSIWSKGDAFIKNGSSGAQITEKEAVDQIVPIGRILVGIASVVLVIAGLMLAVKYMMSGADEKAKLKEKLLWYVISIVLVYGAVGIYTIVTNVMNEVLS